MCEPEVAFESVRQSGQTVLLSMNDLQVALQRAGRNPGADELRSLWDQNSDKLTLERFDEIVGRMPRTDATELRSIFEAVFGDNSGLIPSSELREAFLSGHDGLRPDEVQAILGSTDGNQNIDLREGKFLPTAGAFTDRPSQNLLVCSLEESVQVARKQRTLRLCGSFADPVFCEYFAKRDKLLALWKSMEQVMDQCSSLNKEQVTSKHPTLAFRLAYQNAISAHNKHVPRGWACTHARGAMIFDDINHLFTHQYELYLGEDTELIVSVQLISLPVLSANIDPGFNNVDVELFLLKDSDNKDGHRKLSAFTNSVDSDTSRYSFRTKVAKGHYVLVPSTTGAWFSHMQVLETVEASKEVSRSTPKVDVPLFYRLPGSATELSSEYAQALEAVFEMVDLDGNESLHRGEFDIFARRSTGDIVRDDDWNVVTSSFSTHSDQLNRDGFMQLHRMEASDCKDDDVTDLWIMLESQGFNRALVMDRAIPFVVFISCSNCNPRITPTEMRLASSVAEKATIRTALEHGHVENVTEDVILHKFTNGLRMSLVLENKGTKSHFIECDVTETENCISSKKFPLEVLLIPQKPIILAHFVPVYRNYPWRVNTRDIIKVV